MEPSFFDTVSTLPPESIYLVILASVLRPLGLLFGFVAFEWGMGSGRTIRMAAAFALSLPLVVGNISALVALIENASPLDLALLMPKELAIGYGLGVLASLPFLGLQYAGEVTDAFRGEGSSGLQDPTGGEISTLAMLYAVTAFLLFFASDGLWALTSQLYLSYVLWPLDTLLPSASGDTLGVLFDMLHSMFVIMVRTVLPLLAALVIVEVLLAIGMRLAHQMGLENLTFLAKNLIFILLLPVLVYYAGHMTQLAFDDVWAPLADLEGLLR